MTIAEKLQTIAENEPKVYEAGREKGYREGYTDATSGTAFETDDSTAYLKIVPSASEKLAQVLKLGGMSYKTTNLIPYPYLETTHTDKGVTWTDNGDGSVTATGSATAYTDMRLAIIEALPNTTYVFSGMANTENMTFEISLRDESNTSVSNFGLTSKIASGKMVVNTANYPTAKKFQLVLKRNLDSDVSGTAYPMCNYGETAFPYSPWFEGIRSAKVTELVSEGANKFNPDAEPSIFSRAKLEVLNGNSWRVISEISGAYTPQVRSAPIPILGNKLYVKTKIKPFGKVTNGQITASLRDKNGTKIVDICKVAIDRGTVIGEDEYANFGSIGQYPNAAYIDFVLYANMGEDCDIGDGVEYSNIMVSFDADVPYTPFVGTLATKPIPEALRNFLEQYGYGLGINETYYNYIDYVRKVFAPNVKAVDLGSLVWQSVGGRFRTATPISNIKYISNTQSICLSDIYENYAYNELYSGLNTDGFKGISVDGSGYIQVVDKSYSTVSDFSSAMQGKKLIYAVAEPIEIDISAYLTGDSFIEVQGGGTITAVNEYELAAPTTIQFIKKVGA